MIRTIRAVLILAVVGMGVGAVVAQTDPISARKDLMKQSNKFAKSVNAMAKGEEPFTSETVAAAYATWDKTANEYGKLFPDNSKEGGNTRAKAVIWEKRKDFDAKVAAFAKAVAEGKPKASSLDGVKAAMPAINDACNNCHEIYRAPQKK
ncbi:MAG TPA: cytochrome c [Xanthobacteraceae bacterium]|nr:cytochrome c [Xanthobacteraceae bacterium]